MDEREIIANNIIYYRKKMGLSQLELSKKLQYSNKNISKWEKGETTPSIFTLKKLAEIFEITLDELTSPIDGNKEGNAEKPGQKIKMSMGSKILWLLLSNAILLVAVTIAVYVLAILNVTAINKWFLYLYATPLNALSVFIFIACIKKRVDIISISISGWLLALCIFLTFRSVTNVEIVFLLMAALQLLTICMMLIINLNIIQRFKNKMLKNKEKNVDKDNKAE